MLNINGSVWSVDGLVANVASVAAETTLIHAETTLIHGETTLIAKSLYSRTGVMPNLAAAINVTPSATAWKLGAGAAIVATAGLTSAFQITGINIEGVGTTSADVQIIVYKGTAITSAVAAVRARCSTAIGLAGGVNGMHIPVITKSIAANKCIYAKVAALTTTVPVPAISISYKMG